MSGFVAQRHHLMTRLRDAERSHAPRSHIRRDLVKLTTEQLQVETRAHLPIGRIIAISVLILAVTVYAIAFWELAK